MIALEGWAQFSCCTLILTGDLGDFASRVTPTFWGDDGLEKTDFRPVGLVVALVEELGGGSESTAAIANGIRVSSLRGPWFDQASELTRSQLDSGRDESNPASGDVARLAHCYCDGCGKSSCCIWTCFQAPFYSAAWFALKVSFSRVTSIVQAVSGCQT